MHCSKNRSISHSNYNPHKEQIPAKQFQPRQHHCRYVLMEGTKPVTSCFVFRKKNRTPSSPNRDPNETTPRRTVSPPAKKMATWICHQNKLHPHICRWTDPHSLQKYPTRHQQIVVIVRFSKHSNLDMLRSSVASSEMFLHFSSEVRALLKGFFAQTVVNLVLHFHALDGVSYSKFWVEDVGFCVKLNALQNLVPRWDLPFLKKKKYLKINNKLTRNKK